MTKPHYRIFFSSIRKAKLISMEFSNDEIITRKIDLEGSKYQTRVHEVTVEIIEHKGPQTIDYVRQRVRDHSQRAFIGVKTEFEYVS